MIKTMMDKEHKSGPPSSRLADALYTLGLLSADEGQFLRLLTSQEMEKFEEWLKDES